MKPLLLTGALLLLGLCAHAQQLIYRPQNPSFGGNTFNYQWMLSSAQAQDRNRDPDAISRDPFARGNSLDDFSDSFQRQLLSRITTDILNRQFGQDGQLKEGTFQYGDLTVDIRNSLDGVIIRIVDGKGGETSITVPYY